MYAGGEAKKLQLRTGSLEDQTKVQKNTMDQVTKIAESIGEGTSRSGGHQELVSDCKAVIEPNSANGSSDYRTPSPR
eukprot:6356703-Pyramimonas_sp.AAC.1